MQCCAPRANEAGRFFSWFARRSRRHYEKRGLGKVQRQLLDGIRSQGVEDTSVLEVGCGVGYLHQALLIHGAARATGVDLSESMIAEARAMARERALEERTEYRLGDFMEVAKALPQYDVTVLDKVVCCYPDAEGLINTSIGKTARVYALTYPRPHMINRLLTAVEAAALWLIRCNFRPYIHEPADIERWIEDRGFRKQFEDSTFIWLTQIYSR